MNNTILTADRLSPEAPARIVGLRGPETLTRRLMELGLIPGAVLVRRYTAPAGSPIAFAAGGVVLALRTADAARIAVQEVDAPWTV